MRTYRLIILLFLGACKASTSTGPVGEYSEDLAIHRPIIQSTQQDSLPDAVAKKEDYRALEGHIKNELDSISKIALQQNKEGRFVEGHVIQVYSGNSREKANNARYRMSELFPDLNPRVSYHQPNFRVKAGKFINRLEAHRVYQQVKEDFPQALLIPERFLLKYE